MLCDFYELTMGNGYYRNGFYKRNVYFDVFFRNVPDGGGFAIAAGLEQIVEYIQQLHFSDDDIAYLRGKGIFDEGFLNYLKNFKFHGDIYAVPEGTPVFPGEPLLTVRAPAIEAQLIETYLLLEINHQSLIATKANRIVRAAQGRAVLEFGSRRAQGADGAVIELPGQRAEEQTAVNGLVRVDFFNDFQQGALSGIGGQQKLPDGYAHLAAAGHDAPLIGEVVLPLAHPDHGQGRGDAFGGQCRTAGGVCLVHGRHHGRAF